MSSEQMRELVDAVAEWRENTAANDRLRDERLIPLVRALVADGVSQREIHRVTGVNLVTIGRWVRGESSGAQVTRDGVAEAIARLEQQHGESGDHVE